MTSISNAGQQTDEPKRLLSLVVLGAQPAAQPDTASASHPDVQQALRAATAAIYFADSSDYCTALWDVVRALSPGTADLLENNPNEAFKLTHPDLS